MDRTCQKPRDVRRLESLNAVRRDYLSSVLVPFTIAIT